MPDELKVKQSLIRLMKGDITALEIEAFVYYARPDLVLGTGFGGAISVRGGPKIQEELKKLGVIGTGEAVTTSAGNMKAKYIIHAVGPRQGEDREDEKLARATFNSLRIAQEKKLQSIAFPAISTGVYGFPLQKCSEIMLRTTVSFLRENECPKDVVFCLYGDEALAVFKNTLEKLGS